MFSELIKITDSEMADRAAAGGWCVDALAENCGASVSTLERFFYERKRQCPRDWMLEERMRRARASLQAGRNVQQAADDAGFKNQHHFSLVFKKVHDYCPKEHKARMEALKKKMENGKLKMARNGSPQSSVLSPQSKVRSPKSAVQSPQSKVRSPKSAVQSPQ